MNKQIILNFIKKYFFIALSYIKEKFGPRIVEALKSAWEHFIEVLWDSIKQDIKEQVEETCEFVNNYLSSEEIKEKENIILENLLENIHLPILLKPFKPLIKKIIKKKMETLVKKTLRKLQESI